MSRWTAEDDNILAETIQRLTKEGSSIKDAIAEAANILGRSPGACQFRWTTKIKQELEDQTITIDSIPVDLKEIKQYLKAKQVWHTLDLIQETINLKKQLEDKEQLIQYIKQENQELKEELKQMKAMIDPKALTITKDYQTLIEIIQRARELTLFEEEKVTFKMETNGNIERVKEHKEG